MDFTAVSRNTQMKPSGKEVYLNFRAHYPHFGYEPKSQKVYFDK